jgi:hypothetical protein
LGRKDEIMNAARQFEENAGRFKELILYISQKCANDPKFDTLKLNKLMFFADYWAYGIYGEPITGFQYVKLEKGPAPKKMVAVKREMESEKALAQQPLPLKAWRRPVNLRAPDLSVFKPEQISIVDAFIEACKDVDGESLSDITHKMPCWTVPKLGEVIPYEMVFLSHEEPTNADIERGRAVAAELGLLEHQPTA